jgi:hypothetical protein
VFHGACADRAAHFVQQFGHAEKDIRNKLNTSRMEQVCES